MGTSVAALRLLSAARHPAAAARPRNFAHAAVRATPSVHSTHRRDRVVAWTTRWNLGRNLTVTRAVAEPHSGSSSPNDDETDETDETDEIEGDELDELDSNGLDERTSDALEATPDPIDQDLPAEQTESEDPAEGDA